MMKALKMREKGTMAIAMAQGRRPAVGVSLSVVVIADEGGITDLPA